MCDFQQLYLGQEGYLVRCLACGNLQLAFGTAVITLNEADFQSFRQLVKDRQLLDHTVDEGHLKKVVLPIPYAGVHLLLTYTELDQLDEMLDEGDSEMTSLAMLELFAEN
jgi:hypothetical protein